MLEDVQKQRHLQTHVVLEVNLLRLVILDNKESICAGDGTQLHFPEIPEPVSLSGCVYLGCPRT